MCEFNSVLKWLPDLCWSKMMADSVDFIFQSLVELQNKPYLLSLSKFKLSWETTRKARASDDNSLEPIVRHDACVDLREVVGVKAIKIPLKQTSVNSHELKKAYRVDENALFSIEMQPIGPVGFSVYVISRSRNHKWRIHQISFQCKDSGLCMKWINIIKDALKSKVFNRPRKLIVFVNPMSGKTKAVKIYKDKVLPLFDLADIKVHLIETERQNHARELIQESLDLSDVDGLICVGGDGMFSEILNGLLNQAAKASVVETRNDFELVSPSIRIGVIPAGSTNTVVCTTVGVCDPVTSVLHIILGDSIGIDVNSVWVNDEFQRYSVTLLGYGYMGDLLKDSDSLRWMGPKRYNFSGTKKFLANNSYYGKIKFRLSSNSDSHPTDEVKCYSGCSTCYQASEENRALEFSVGESLPSDETQWQTVTGKFVAVNMVTMSCSCDLSPPGMSPYCHLGDGCMDLILVSDCSRLDFLKFLLKTAKGKERHDLDFIKTYRVKEFSFRPLTEDSDLETVVALEDLSSNNKSIVKLKRNTLKTSVWNCDGEVIHEPKINVRVHCQLVKLFARGVEDPCVTDERCQVCCCDPTFNRC